MFSRTENPILGALSHLQDFFLNPLFQGHSGTSPETPWNTKSTNQGTNEDDSQSDPHPEAGIFRNQMTRNSDPEDGHGHDMVTRDHGEVTYCSHRTFSGKQKKNLSSKKVRLPLRRLKQTRFCWPFSSWQTTTLLQVPLTMSTKFPNCQNRSRQQCQRLTGSLKSLNCLKNFSKRVSKFINS